MPSIAIIAPYDLTKMDGNALRPLMEARGLLENGFDDFVVVCLKQNPALSIPQHEMNRGLFSRLPRRLRPENADFLPSLPFVRKVRGLDGCRLFHAHNIYGYYLAPRGARKILDLHTVKANELRNTYPQPHYGAFKNALYKHIIARIIRLLERNAVRRAERVIVASANIKETIAAEYGCPPEKIAVVNNMVDAGRFSINEHRTDLSLLVVGSFKNGINREVVAEVERLAAALPYAFHLAGSIFDEDAERLGARANVKVHGRVTDGAYLDLLATAGALILPYRTFRDGGGSRNKLIEAAAAGTPVIGTRAGLEGFAHEPGALRYDDVVDLAPILADLASHPERRRELGAVLSNVVRTSYDFRVVGRVLRGLYRELLGAAAPRGAPSGTCPPA